MFYVYVVIIIVEIIIVLFVVVGYTSTKPKCELIGQEKRVSLAR